MSSTVNARVEALIREIVRKEGGFVSAERARRIGDAGGATNFGISLRYARSKGLMYDLDHDGDVDEADIRLVTAETAYEAFLDDFYLAPAIDRLPDELQAAVTDYAVNSGPGRAIRALQSVMRDFGYNVAVDGACGPRTQAAAKSLRDTIGTAAFVNALVDERVAFLTDLVRRSPDKAPNLKGWLRRARSFAA